MLIVLFADEVITFLQIILLLFANYVITFYGYIITRCD